MHLVFVSREYPPNPMGGIGTYVANMTAVAARAGDTVSVLTTDSPAAPSHGFDHPFISENGRLKVYYLPFADENWNLLPQARSPLADALARRDTVAAFGPVVTAALERLLLSGDVDAIEAPEYEAPLLDFQIHRAALPFDHPWQAVPTVVHLHSPSHMIFEANDDDTANRWVRARKANEALSIELADGVLAPSAFLAGQVSRWLSLASGRVQVIPYPIGPLLTVPSGIEPEEALCLFVGRVEPRKGVFEFTQAAVRAAARFPKARFRFVGGPHHRGGKSTGAETAELIQSLIPTALRPRFDFAGKVPRETLGSEYARASFVAVPSRWENYPNTCMEAMSCGRAVLASDQGGMPEMLDGANAGIVAAGDTREKLADSLHEGLCAMLSRPSEELLAMGENGRRRILEICDDAQIVLRHRDYYARLASQRRNRCRPPALRSGVILFGGDAGRERALRSLEALSVQTADLTLRLLAGPPRELAVSASGPRRIPGDAEGRADALPPLSERLKAVALPEVLYVGLLGDVLPPDALDAAANVFANFPEVGVCAMRSLRRGELCAAFRNSPEHLVSPAAFPERWFFRASALEASGGLIGRGYHLSDLLRDAVLRILEKGWRMGLAPVAVDPAASDDAQVIRAFAFCDRPDSIREVVLAHRKLLAGAIPENPARSE